MGWFCVEDEGNQVRKERHPLLVGHVPVTVAKQQEFKVTAASSQGTLPLGATTEKSPAPTWPGAQACPSVWAPRACD